MDKLPREAIEARSSSMSGTRDDRDALASSGKLTSNAVGRARRDMRYPREMRGEGRKCYCVKPQDSRQPSEPPWNEARAAVDASVTRMQTFSDFSPQSVYYNQPLCLICRQTTDSAMSQCNHALAVVENVSYHQQFHRIARSRACHNTAYNKESMVMISDVCMRCILPSRTPVAQLHRPQHRTTLSSSA